MTNKTSFKTYPINNNYSLFIEKYSIKPFDNFWYRYGLVNHNDNDNITIYANMLLTRPKPKKCIERLSGMI